MMSEQWLCDFASQLYAMSMACIEAMESAARALASSTELLDKINEVRP